MEKIYPYAVSKIKVKENKLLTKVALEQLANERNIEKIVSVLREKDYNFDIIERNEDFENVLKYEEEQLYKLIKDIIDENDFIEIFLSQNDYYNIKLILKSKIQKKEYKDNLVDSGIIPKQQIISIMENEEYNKFDNDTKNAIYEALEKYQKNKMPFIIDAILDKACFKKMEKLSKKIKNEFIQKYIEKLIDITNIKTFFRIRKIYKDSSIFKIAYIQGGKISLKTFMDNINEDDQNLRNKFSGFSETIEQALYNYEELDKFCDNYIMKYMKDAKLKALTIEPIVAYTYAKQIEIKNIRIIFTGKLNNINCETIKERLRESYV